jgi:hypothetical protein
LDAVSGEPPFVVRTAEADALHVAFELDGAAATPL